MTAQQAQPQALEEEDDYMSAAFIVDAAPPATSSQAPKRKREVQPEKKPLKVLEKEKLKEGLATAISSDNKGFKMLKMMGYKEGSALGRKAEESEGLKEPIAISLRTDRSGLGRLEEIQRVSEDQFRQKKAQEQNLASTYKDRMKERFGERKAHSQLKQAFNICVQLDQEKGLAYSPHLREFEEEEKRKEAEGDAYAPVAWEFEEVLRRLDAVLAHLREQHFYCFYCGCAFNDADDLAQNCPGPSEEDHE